MHKLATAVLASAAVIASIDVGASLADRPQQTRSNNTTLHAAEPKAAVKGKAHATFAGVAWGSDSTALQTRMDSINFEKFKTMGDESGLRSHAYMGRLFGEKAIVITAAHGSTGIQSIDVVFMYAEAGPMYFQMFDRLERQYGEAARPHVPLGQAGEADKQILSIGEDFPFFSVWATDDTIVALSVGSDGHVRLKYFGPKYAEMFKAMRASAREVL